MYTMRKQQQQQQREKTRHHVEKSPPPGGTDDKTDGSSLLLRCPTVGERVSLSRGNRHNTQICTQGNISSTAKKLCFRKHLCTKASKANDYA